MTRNKQKKTTNVSVQQLALEMHKLMSKPSTSAKPKKNRRKRNRRVPLSSNSAEGLIHLKRCELLASLKTDAKGILAPKTLDLLPSSFTFLKGISKSFERSKWNSLRIWYKPAVAVTTGGLLSVGVDWDFAATPTDRVQVAAYTPNFTTAIWQETQDRPMTLPPNRLMSTQWYQHNADETKVPLVDRGPCRLIYSANASVSAETFIGELWAEYSITMMGTQPSL